MIVSPLVVIALIVIYYITGRYVYVPQGTLGKVLTPNGYSTDIIRPSRVHLGLKDKIILLEDIIVTKEEKVTVRMEGNLNLIVMVRFQIMLSRNDKNLNMLFASSKTKGSMITINSVYNTYGKIVVNKITREVISEYNILDVNKNFKRISKELYAAINKEFIGSPLRISDTALGKLIFPKEVEEALGATIKRKLEVKRVEADVEAKLTEFRGKKRIAEAQYLIEMQKAKATRDYNKMISDGLTPELLDLKRLDVQTQMIEAVKENKNAIYIPMNMFGTVTPTVSIKK
jgi:bifunctional DNA-binding transcriptional regulator/antitoxin component of YhaV-PrlF toxin-antitoxin module